MGSYLPIALLALIAAANAQGSVTINTNPPLIYYGSILANWSLSWTSRPASVQATWVRGRNPCRPKWAFVTCGLDTSSNATTITAIKVNGVALGGTLPGALSSISTLKELVVTGAQMKGSLPNAWGNAGAFQRLQRLSLTGNNLEGTLPASWGSASAFAQLKWLLLDSNQLSGALPEAWGNPGAFKQLLTLDTSNNTIWGPLPGGSWGQRGSFPKLRTLDLSSNQLTGTLTPSWGTSLTSLTALIMTTNQVGGVLPDAWGAASALPSLVRLRLDDNQLYGQLPGSWGAVGSFPILTELRLGANLLTGGLPETWGAPGTFPNLALLDIGRNSLSGSLPSTWGVPVDPATARRALQQTEADADGSIWEKPALPSGSTFLSAFVAAVRDLIDGGGEGGGGAAPLVSKPSFAALRALDMSYNQLSSALPAEWGYPGAWPKLQELVLAGNDLGLITHGPVPSSWLAAENPRVLPSLVTLALYPGNEHVCGGNATDWDGVRWQVVNTQEPPIAGWEAGQQQSGGLEDFQGLGPAPAYNASAPALLLDVAVVSVEPTAEKGLPACPGDEVYSSSSSSSSSSYSSSSSGESSSSYSSSGEQHDSTSGQQEAGLSEEQHNSSGEQDSSSGQ